MFRTKPASARTARCPINGSNGASTAREEKDETLPRKTGYPGGRFATRRRKEGDGDGQGGEEGVGLLVLVSALGDAEEVDAVPDDGSLDRYGGARPSGKRGGVNAEAGGIDDGGCVVRAEEKLPETDQGNEEESREDCRVEDALLPIGDLHSLAGTRGAKRTEED